MIRAVVLSLAVLSMSATSYGADPLDAVAAKPEKTYTYVVGMSGVT